MRRTKALFAAALGLWLFLPAVAVPQEAAGGSPSLFIATADKDEATTQLVQFLGEHGFVVKKRQGQLMAVEKDGFTLALGCEVRSRGLDRLIATNWLPIQRKESAQAELHAIVTKLNQQSAGINYSLDGDGDLLIQVLVTFVDTLSLAEVDAVFDYMEDLEMATVLSAPELIQHLRR